MHTKVLALLLLAASGSAGSGCASSGTPVAVAPGGPIELNDTSWKLLNSRGKLDGRVIKFRKVKNGYIASLVTPGLQLRNVPGIREGMEVLILEKSGTENEYNGQYQVPNADGSPSSRPCVVTVGPDGLNWNLEAVTWVKVE